MTLTHGVLPGSALLAGSAIGWDITKPEIMVELHRFEPSMMEKAAR
jgi:hypothetical protein